MKTLKHFAVLIAFLGFYTIHAQTNYQRGGVELNNGTIINGYINYKEWANTPQSIQFKMDDNKVQDFNSSAIKGFWIDDIEEYQKHYVSITIAPSNKIEELTSGRDLSRRADSILLKKLVSGTTVDLLEYKDKIKTRYYLLEHARDTIYELVQLKYLDKDQDRRIITDNIFRNQLLNLSVRYNGENGKQLKRIIENSNYRDTDLKRIIQLLNNDKQEAPMQKTYNAYAGIAMINSRAHFWGNHPFAQQPASLSFNPKVSLGIDVFLNPYIKKTFIRFDLSFAILNHKIEGLTYQSHFETITETYQIRQLATQLCPQLIHNFFNKPFLRINSGIGFGAEISGNLNSNLRTSRLRSGESYDRPYQINTLRILIPFRAGVIIKDKFDMYLQHNLYLSRLDNFVYKGIRTSTTQLGINYLF